MSDRQPHGHDYSTTSGDEFEAIHHVKNTKTQRIFQALFLGVEVKLGDHTWRLFEHDKSGYCPGIVDSGRLICGMPDLTLVAFSSMCERMPEEDFKSLEANYFFNVMRQK